MSGYNRSTCSRYRRQNSSSRQHWFGMVFDVFGFGQTVRVVCLLLCSGCRRFLACSTLHIRSREHKKKQSRRREEGCLLMLMCRVALLVYCCVFGTFASFVSCGTKGVNPQVGERIAVSVAGKRSGAEAVEVFFCSCVLFAVRQARCAAWHTMIQKQTHYSIRGQKNNFHPSGVAVNYAVLRPRGKAVSAGSRQCTRVCPWGCGQAGRTHREYPV